MGKFYFYYFPLMARVIKWVIAFHFLFASKINKNRSGEMKIEI